MGHRLCADEVTVGIFNLIMAIFIDNAGHQAGHRLHPCCLAVLGSPVVPVSLFGFKVP